MAEITNETLSTSSVNPFIYVPPINPPSPSSSKLGLIIGLSCGGGALILIVVCTYCYFKKYRKTPTESDALQTIYQNN